MRLNMVLSVGLLGLMALPGLAGTPHGVAAPDAQLLRLAQAQAEFGMALDPHAAPRFSFGLSDAVATLLGEPVRR